MGQVLFEPPSVFGWDWESAWLSSSTLLARYGFARDLTGARDGGKTSLRPERLPGVKDLVGNSAADPGAIVDAVTELLGVKDQIGAAERTALIVYVTDGAGASATVDLSDEAVRFQSASSPPRRHPPTSCTERDAKEPAVRRSHDDSS
jgi:hypothetical protein